ncbi:MAG: hypothetical protein ABFS14_13000 [Gemmatimonadota bacterium]
MTSGRRADHSPSGGYRIRLSVLRRAGIGRKAPFQPLVEAQGDQRPCYLQLAGFSGIAVAFTRKPGELSQIDAFRVALLFWISFGAVFMALFLWALLSTGAADDTAWRLSNSLMALYGALFLTVFVRRSHRLFPKSGGIFDLRVAISLAVIHAINIAAQSAGALGALGQRARGVFLWGLLFWLFHSAQQFSRIMFIRPR